MRNTRRETKRPPGSFEAEYASLLHDYAADGREQALGMAYDLGRKAITQQKSLVELASLHHQVLQELYSQTKDRKEGEELLRAGASFLAECLSPYEMAHRGFQDSVRALRHLNETLEEEIKRIAYSVHDEAGQLLVAVHLALAELAGELPAHRKSQITRIDELLNDVEKHLRRYSHELRPTILDDLGWIPAIRFLAEGISKRASLPIHIEAAASGRLPTAMEVTLYRTVQEALSNSVKHANAKNIWVRTWMEDQVLNCSIRDDGAGFDPHSHNSLGQTRRHKGLGLVAMRERVSAVGGTLRIESAAGKGTELSVRLPLEASYVD
ncbi:MAG TPA: ATP-binding protein [Candidatus Acidoferrum sp.]|nr:ATP-binding protein [Candidatus Acidoferrum sp.]